MKIAARTFRLLLFILIISCNQSDYDNCLEDISDSPNNHLISSSDFDLAKSLFEFNNIDYSRYQFFEYTKDYLGSYHVKFNQYINNLKLFSGSAIIHFDKDKKFKSDSYNLIEQIDLDTKRSMNIDNVVQIFFNKVFENTQTNISNLCFDVEFGYFDLNSGISNATNNFIKAWKVTLKNSKFPLALINDTTSEIVYFDNGYITKSVSEN